jgi:UDP-2,4-diacetamido-2,4,6-trideoxy-beta-L-altropyranose hydrolase
MPPSTATAYSAGSIPALSGVLMQIVADGGARHGFGHVGRCLALWEAMDGAASFALGEPSVDSFLSARGAAPAADAGDAPVVLLDRVEPTDAAQVRALQQTGRRVVLLDDRGAGRMVADLVVDPPTASGWPPAGPNRLAGFEHVLLRREVSKARRASSPSEVLLALGGSDPTGLTPLLAAALADAGVALAVNLGPGYGAERDLPGRVLDAPEQFAGELAGARLLVASYGHALLEAAHLGVPAVVVVTRADHLEHATAFVGHGTAELVDMSDGARPAELAALVQALLADGDRAGALAARGRALVDGRGARRVAAAIRALVS